MSNISYEEEPRYCGRFLGLRYIYRPAFMYVLLGENGEFPTSGVGFQSKWPKSGIFQDTENATTEEIDMFNILYPNWLHTMGVHKRNGVWMLERYHWVYDGV